MDVHAGESMVSISFVATSYENVLHYFSFHFVLFNISSEIGQKLFQLGELRADNHNAETTTVQYLCDIIFVRKTLPW